ncbi:hypothetical protein WN72_04550 [Bradyrhizobium arachidis]|uniref:Uncharacterized protein n=2 Tax=Nitrobacteraceae TaxID=41294 RepID=A0AAE7NW61_9BRAD|nr:hypothetical protein WN72_04550 [Bradyrhizobium arachidis]
MPSSILPIVGASVLNKSRTVCPGQFAIAPRRITSCPAVCDFPFVPARLCSAFSLERNSTKILVGVIRMKHVMRVCPAAALLLTMLAPAARADDYQLSHNQRISCSRGLAPGKLNTATCKSYTYLFNTKTSEYFRCQVSLALTRDNKEVINVQTDGGCTKKPRIFETDGKYDFDATETEPPNTNSFFGPGGYSIWAADVTAQKVRGCITISSGLGSDISKCLDMTFQ